MAIPSEPWPCRFEPYDSQAHDAAKWAPLKVLCRAQTQAEPLVVDEGVGEELELRLQRVPLGVGH